MLVATNEFAADGSQRRWDVRPRSDSGYLKRDCTNSASGSERKAEVQGFVTVPSRGVEAHALQW